MNTEPTRKQKEAKERNEAWVKLSPQQQLDDLDRRLGVGVGAKKQRARLQKLISGNQKAVEAKVEAPSEVKTEEVKEVLSCTRSES